MLMGCMFSINMFDVPIAGISTLRVLFGTIINGIIIG